MTFEKDRSEGCSCVSWSKCKLWDGMQDHTPALHPVQAKIKEQEQCQANELELVVLYDWAKSKSGYGQADWMYETLCTRVHILMMTNS